MTLWVFLVFPIHYPAPSFVGTPWLWLVKSTSYQMSEPFYGKFPTWIAFKSSEIPSTPTKSSWFNQPDQWWKRQHTFKQELTTGFQSRLSNPLLRRLVTWTCTRTPARRTESWSSHEQLRVLCSKPTWLKIYKKNPPCCEHQVFACALGSPCPTAQGQCVFSKVKAGSHCPAKLKYPAHNPCLLHA